MRVKTGRYYWTKRKFWGGFDLWVEEKVTNDRFYPEFEYTEYRKGTYEDLIQLKIIQNEFND